ncbi:MAG TPA: HD domain-containing phosphohydrolase [Thermoanaerobaculia bacterium]|nr:HD domain-containing phosphohydrolase [Thermoanaerobaculia bacterium]
MHPEVERARSKIKEILYDCAVEIRATKAAVFLSDGMGKFELMAEFGFRLATRHFADRDDPVVDRCERGRTAFFINGLVTEPRFSELLYEASTDRILAVPLYQRGQLVGVIDMRDKPNKQPFDEADLPKAQAIADRIGDLFKGKNVFNQRFISISDGEHPIGESVFPLSPPRAATPGTQPLSRPPAAPPQVVAQPGSRAPRAPAPPGPGVAAGRADAAAARSPRPADPLVSDRTVPAAAPAPKGVRDAAIDGLVAISRKVVDSRVLIPPQPETLVESDLAGAADVMRTMLLLPGAVVACFSAFGHLGGVQEIVSKAPLTDEAMALLQSKLTVWLAKRGERGGDVRRNVHAMEAGPVIVGARLLKVLTAPVSAGAMRGLFLTVGFEVLPGRDAHEMLALFLGQLRIALEHSTARDYATKNRMAARLLEPDLSRYPQLRRHSQEVATTSVELARLLALTVDEVENIRLVGLLHDVGMRLLQYERLYIKRDVSEEELGVLREHPVIGAALVEPVFGSEIARAVLFHHERFDGGGYPLRISGERIPLAARIVHVCDAWVAMTDPYSYRLAVSPEKAIETIASLAGTQFDPEIVPRFQELVRKK